MPLTANLIHQRATDSTRFQSSSTAISPDGLHVYVVSEAGDLLRFNLPTMTGETLLASGVGTAIKGARFATDHPTRLILTDTTHVQVYDTVAETLSTLISEATWNAATASLPSLAQELNITADGVDAVWVTSGAASNSRWWAINPTTGAISMLPRPSNHFTAGLARGDAGEFITASNYVPRSLVYRVHPTTEDHVILVGTPNSGSNVAGDAFTTASLATMTAIHGGPSDRLYFQTSGGVMYLEGGTLSALGGGFAFISAYLRSDDAFVVAGSYLLQYWRIV